MRIVDRATFLAMPSGTVFCKFAPMYFGELAIKVDNAGANDFCVQDLNHIESRGDEDWASRIDDAMDGASIALDLDCSYRDGCFDADQLFAVYERPDVEAMIARLQRALA